MAKKIKYSKSGAPIYYYDPKDPQYVPPVFEHEEIVDLLENHIEQHVGKIDYVFHELISDRIHLDVHVSFATPERDYHVLVTSGMSTLPMSAPEGAEDFKYAELAIILPSSWQLSEEAFEDDANYWPIYVLKTLARFPHEWKTWLCWGHTVPNGNPERAFSKDTQLSATMLVSSISLDESFGELKISEDKTIHFFTLLPLYKEEVDFKLKYGAEKLLEKMDGFGLSDIVDIKRVNTCKKKFLFW